MSAWLQRRVLVVFGLVCVWMLGWGEVSVANALSGIAVAVLALTVFPLEEVPGAGRPRVHPLADREARLVLRLGAPASRTSPCRGTCWARGIACRRA